VPRQVYELAARLLPLAAPGLAPLEVVRDGPADPRVHRVEPADRAARAVAVAMEHAEAGRFVGLVCPPGCREELAEALAANRVEWSDAQQADLGTTVTVVAPHEAKGLEFDAVIVLEPEEIVAGDERGHRTLFIALTRTTRYLDIVAVGDPLPLARPVPVPPSIVEPEPDASRLDRLAAQVASAVVGGAPAAEWYEVLTRAAAILDAQGEPPGATGRHRRS
jgi:hypothetical protein